MGCHALIQIFLTQGWNSHLLQSPALAGRFCTTGTYKLNKQGDNIQPYPTPFPILNQSVIPCKVLTVASGPSYKFLRRQVRWSGIPISLRIFQFVVIRTIKDFSVINEAEVDVFLEFSCFRASNVDNLISGSSASSKPSLYIWKFSVQVLLKPSLKVTWYSWLYH